MPRVGWISTVSESTGSRAYIRMGRVWDSLPFLYGCSSKVAAEPVWIKRRSDEQRNELTRSAVVVGGSHGIQIGPAGAGKLLCGGARRRKVAKQGRAHGLICG